MDQDLFQEPATCPRSLVVCCGVSLLLHAGLLGVLGPLHLFTQASEPLEVVNVHLFEIQTVAPPPLNPRASSTDEVMPPMKTVSRPKVNPSYSPVQKSISLVEFSQISRQSKVSVITQAMPKPMSKVRPAIRPPLLDLVAENALIVKDLSKVIPRTVSRTQPIPSDSERTQSFEQNIITKIPTIDFPIRERTARESVLPEELRSTSARRTLVMDIPSKKEMPQGGLAKKQPLENRLAQNTREANELYKIVPHTNTNSNPFPTSRPAGVFPSNHGAEIPSVASSIQKTAVLNTLPAESHHASSSRRSLSMNIPSGEGGLGKTGARLAQSIPPVYPRIAREEGWEGIVVLRVRLHKDGTPENVSVKKTSGYNVLDQAALQAIYGWSFVPAKDGNIPIPSLVDIPVRFDLTNG